jgi:radical SAM superfamily enzyme YgiQ (UPF0313 family)
MQQLQETGVTYFYFIDEIFNIPGSHTKELLAALQKQNITFGCQCRPDIMTNEFLDLMVGAGCIHIEYGLESLNQDDLDAIGKNTSLEQSLKIIEKTSMLVPYTALFMLTFDTMTLAHKKGPPKKFSFKKCELSPARPYPTTELFKNLQANLGITIPEELQWEFIQKYVWHLGRLYAWIPIRLFIYIPYCLLVFFTTVMRKLRATILRKEW